MPGKFRNRILIVVITVLLLAAVLLLSSLPGSPINDLTSPISAFLEPVQKSLIGASDQVTGFFETLREGMRIRQENRDLLQENASLRNQIAQLEEAGRQYAELKEAFQLKDQFDGYDILGARVMTREIGAWFDVFRIDLGKTDGIGVTETLSFAVVDAQSRLIGRVLSTDAVSGKVLPLLHEGFAVAAKVNKLNGALMSVRGDFDLKEQALCTVYQIPANADLQVGDELVTSGIGGLFPAGIKIGTIVSISDKDTREQRSAILKPYADLENLSTVFVMRGKEQP